MQQCPKQLQDTLIHHQVLEIIWNNIFLRPEEAMFENWQSFSSNKKLSSVYEKITTTT